MQRRSVDLAILGGGTVALTAASAARELDKTVAVIERRSLGGTCMNRGCVPSKNLIEAARLVHDASHPRFPGLQPATMQVDFTSLIEQKDAMIRDSRKNKVAMFDDDDGLFLVEGDAAFVNEHTVRAGGTEVSAERFLIATGSKPVIPEIDGLDETPHVTSDLLTTDEPMEWRTLPESLIIVGGGYVALELGQMFCRLGSPVTLVERSSHVLANGYEPEVGPCIERILRDEGLTILTDTDVERVERVGDRVRVHVRRDGSEETIQAERLVIATGRQPNTDGLGLSQAGLQTDDSGAIIVDEFLRTSVERIFAAGDVIAGQHGAQMATPVGTRDGRKAVHNAFHPDDLKSIDHRVVPRAIFTDPPIAVVGVIEDEARKSHAGVWSETLSMEEVSRAGIIRDTRGLIKMIVDESSDKLLGVSIVSRGAGEIIHLAALAMHQGATRKDLTELTYVFPTMSEAIRDIAGKR